MLVVFDTEVTLARLNDLIVKEKLDEQYVFDFTNSLEKSGYLSGFKFIYPHELDKNFNMHEAAVTNYVNEISKLGLAELSNGNNLRSINFAGYPVYWLTKVSLKHAQTSVLKNFFYLMELVKSTAGSVFANQKIVLVMPGRQFYYSSLFIERLSDLGLKDVNTISIGNKEPVYASWSIFSFLKSEIKSYLSLRKRRKEILKAHSPKESDVIFFTYPDSTWKPELQHDYVFKDLNEYISRNKNCSYVPVVTDMQNLSTFEWDRNWNPEFLLSLPSTLEFAIFFIKHCIFLNSVHRLKISSQSKTNYFINQEVLRAEFGYAAYFDCGHVFFYNWLKKYFRHIKNKKIIYQDEFYLSGRLISKARKDSENKSITSLGVQHGLFFDGHTVYTITDTELNGQNPMPVPDKFVVWGKWFKDRFLKNNSLSADYVVEAGNLKYARKAAEMSVHAKASEKQVLWCTTLESDTIQMWKFIKDNFSRLNGYKILIRCHPLFRIENKIQKMLEESNFIRYSFSNEGDIFSDISQSVCMISSNASTTFIDAIIGCIPVINIILPDYLMEKIEIDNVYNVSAGDQFGETLTEVLNAPRQGSNASYSLINSNVANWDILLN